MTENTAPDAAPVEPDFDSWLNGGERKAHFVALYGRADLYAEIEHLQRQRVTVPVVNDDDKSMAGDDNPNADLDATINALWLELDASKKEFRVSARTEPEMAELRAEVKRDMREEADKAADEARADATALAKRLGVKGPNEVNNLVRQSALEASNRVIEREVGVRSLAASTQVLINGDWLPINPDQVRRLEKALGASQMDALNRAYARAANEAPVVTVPK